MTGEQPGTVHMVGSIGAVSARALALVLSVLLVGCTAESRVASKSTTAAGTAQSAAASTPRLSGADVGVLPSLPSLSTSHTGTPDQGPRLSPSVTIPVGKTSTPTSTLPDPYALRTKHDSDFAALLTVLTATLQSGNKGRFLAPFAPPLARRVGRWFTNTRAVGVDAASFVRSDDYSSGATDALNSFTRTVVLGVRTPYDDSGSMAGIPYAVGVSIVPKAGRDVLTITFWQPKYLDDPMNCDCELSVVRSATMAVVTDSADRDLVFWSGSVVDSADSGISWSRAQLAGTGLVAPRGQVIFLADKPFHWFLSVSGPGQRSNMTAGLITALGDYPGIGYSDQSRIVLMLESLDGSVVPNDARGRQYVEDVLTHESVHQLMNRNSKLPGRSENSPPTWVVEGIAVAVETLHRDSLDDPEGSGYAEPNDPRNVDPTWFAAHLTDAMPTKSQLYSSPGPDGSGYYAIAGSVFRYIAREYGYPEMMRVAKAMYARPAQNPFAYFPDPDHPGSYLPAATAKTRWKAWFVDAYE